MDINELLKRVDLQLGTFTEDWVEPNRQVVCLEFLTFAKLEKEDILNCEHWFTDTLVGRPEFTYVIIHGHNYEGTCSSPAMCHLFGYWPDDNYNPRFINQFNMKWKKIYEEKGWKK